MASESFETFCFSIGKIIGSLQNEAVKSEIKKRGATEKDIENWGRVIMEIVQVIYNEDKSNN